MSERFESGRAIRLARAALGVVITIPAVCLFALAACGGDDEADGESAGAPDSSQSLSNQDYFGRLHSIDQQTDARLADEVFGPAGASSARSRMLGLAETLAGLEQELAGLAPPETASAAHEELRRAAGETASAAAALAEQTSTAIGEQGLEVLLLEEPTMLDSLLRLNEANCTLQEVADGLAIAIELECQEALPSFLGVADGSPESPRNGTTIAAVEGEISFETRTIFVRAGQEVVATFVNGDAPRAHDLAFSRHNPLAGEEEYITKTDVIQFQDPPSEEVSFSVSEVGVYYFLCTIHPKLMNGVVIAVE